jgi:hypothetical protein
MMVTILLPSLQAVDVQSAVHALPTLLGSVRVWRPATPSAPQEGPVLEETDEAYNKVPSQKHFHSAICNQYGVSR